MAGSQKTINKKSVPLRIVLGCTLSMILTLVSALGIAFMLQKGMVQETGENYAVLILTALAAFCGSMVATQTAGKSLLLIALGTGCLYLLLLLCWNALFFEGQYVNVGVRLLVVAAGCGCVLLVRMRKKAGNSLRKKYKIR